MCENNQFIWPDMTLLFCLFYSDNVAVGNICVCVYMVMTIMLYNKLPASVLCAYYNRV